MIKKITCLEDVMDIKEIILQDHEISEKYRILQADELSIKILRKGEFSRIRILPLNDIVEGEWYIDCERVTPPDIISNTDGHLLKEINRSQREASD